jgi:PIN domain-containing protein
MARKARPKKWLVFIDANILLDFYRQAGESAIRQLKALEKHRESLILGDQLSMEFLKNRQAAIVAGIQAMKEPHRPAVPSVLLDAQVAKTLMKNHGVTEKKWQQSKKRIERMLTNPSTSDPVYQHLMRIFDHDGAFNLKRPNKLRFTIRNLARKRLALGYPPRKHDATSLGDSIHWEWIVHCAKNSKDHHNVLIVSRDSDFGVTYGGKTTLNDWLYREFKERVSWKRSVELTQKLTDALKRLNEQVTADDLVEEERLIKNVRELTWDDLKLLNWDDLSKIEESVDISSLRARLREHRAGRITTKDSNS